MAFKIRDLMITDLTAPEGTHLRKGSTGSRCATRDCFPRGTVTCANSNMSLLCRVGVGLGPDPATLYEELALLKTQLQEELAEIEKEQEALEGHLRPSTVAEVEELQLKVSAAADELAKLKEELQKKQA